MQTSRTLDQPVKEGRAPGRPCVNNGHVAGVASLVGTRLVARGDAVVEGRYHPVLPHLETEVVGLAGTSFVPVGDVDQEATVVALLHPHLRQAVPVEGVQLRAGLGAGHLVRAGADAPDADPGEFTVHRHIGEGEPPVHPPIFFRRVHSRAVAQGLEGLSGGASVGEFRAGLNKEHSVSIQWASHERLVADVLNAVPVDVDVYGREARQIVAGHGAFSEIVASEKKKQGHGSLRVTVGVFGRVTPAIR